MSIPDFRSYVTAQIQESTGVSRECDKYIRDTVNQLLKPYPKKMKRWLGISYTNSITNEFDGFEKELRFAKYALEGSVEEADQLINKSNPDGYVVGSGLRSLIIHEFGHALDFYIKTNSDDDVRDAWFDDKVEFLASAKKPSPYSQKNRGEHFAELYVYETLRGGGPLTDLIQSYMQLTK